MDIQSVAAVLVQSIADFGHSWAFGAAVLATVNIQFVAEASAVGHSLIMAAVDKLPPVVAVSEIVDIHQLAAVAPDLAHNPRAVELIVLLNSPMVL